MSPDRLKAFSDGVVAIIITIMVLELKVPHGADLAALRPLLPVFLSYVLSFVYRRHLLEQPPSPAARRPQRVNGAILWANLHLLFWLSLIPFATGWMGENHFAPLPTALYGVVLLMPAIAYYAAAEGDHSPPWQRGRAGAALGTDFKGKMSPVLYLVAIGTAFVATWISHAHLCLVALMWLLPTAGSRVRSVSSSELSLSTGRACP